MKYLPILIEFIFILACVGGVEKDQLPIGACLFYVSASFVLSYVIYRLLKAVSNETEE